MVIVGVGFAKASDPTRDLNIRNSLTCHESGTNEERREWKSSGFSRVA